MRPDGPRPLVVGSENGPEPPYPLRLNGKVIKGFGRGSSELGIPTANIPISGLSVGGHSDVESGVYYGWAGLTPSKATHQQQQQSATKEKAYKLMDAQVYEGLTAAVEQNGGTVHEKGAVYPMVMSIGWNPFYKNTVRSVEVHIMHGFDEQFYESHMNLVVLGFIRPELDYVDRESLINDIKTDIDVAGRSLSRDAHAKFARDPYLLDFRGKSEVAS